MKKTKLYIAIGMTLGMGSGLRADFESPGAGPDYNTLIGGSSDQAWSFWLRAYAGYNDNVQLVPDGVFFGGDQESSYLGITAQGAYRFLENGNVQAGALFRYDHTHHFEITSGASSPDNFDSTAFQPGVYLNYNADCWYGRAIYSYRWEDADTQLIGVSSHNLTLMAGTEINPCLKAEVSWTHGWDDFHTPGAGVNDRDGDRDRYTLSLVYRVSKKAPKLAFSYSYLDNDADGSFFRYDGHEFKFSIASPLADKIGAVAYVSYTDLDYSAGARSEQEIVNAGIRVVYIIDDNWSADIYYDHLDIDSNAAFFRGSRNNVGVGLRYDF